MTDKPRKKYAPSVDWAANLDELRQMVADSLGAVDIARRFGCSQSAAERALIRYGLKLDPEGVRARRRAALLQTQVIHKETHRKAMQSPEYRAKRSAIAKELHKRPDYVANYRAGFEAARGKLEDHLRRISKIGHEALRKHHAAKKAAKADAAARAAEEAAKLAAMTPFERQLYKVRNGQANVVRNWKQ